MRTKSFLLGIGVGVVLAGSLPFFLERYVRSPIHAEGTLKMETASVEPTVGAYVEGRIYIVSGDKDFEKNIGKQVRVSGHLGTVSSENGNRYPAIYIK